MNSIRLQQQNKIPFFCPLHPGKITDSVALRLFAATPGHSQMKEPCSDILLMNFSESGNARRSCTLAQAAPALCLFAPASPSPWC